MLIRVQKAGVEDYEIAQLIDLVWLMGVDHCLATSGNPVACPPLVIHSWVLTCEGLRYMNLMTVLEATLGAVYSAAYAGHGNRTGTERKRGTALC